MKRTKSTTPDTNAFARPLHARRTAVPAAMAAAAMFGLANAASAQFYQKTDLTSDVAGRATYLDSHLHGAWGVARSATSPWWVNSTMGGVSVLYNGSGRPVPVASPLVVTVPGPAGSMAGPSMPTGIVFNGGTGFTVAAGMPGRFIFVTRNGTISGWNPAANATQAIPVVDQSAAGADYTGATLAWRKNAPLLYVANFGQNRVDVFDDTFASVMLPDDAFSDDDLPVNFRVFNVQAVGSDVYVTYAPADSFAPTPPPPGAGYVDVYTTDGLRVRRLRHGRWMNAPWGVVQAPADFGHFSNDILVGMFGDGRIAAFSAKNGEYRGLLRVAAGKPLVIARGLWGLEFGNGATAGPANTLYFASDIVDATGFHGVFGDIVAMPPPADQTGG